MKYVDEFRDAQRCQNVLDRILKRASRRWTIMEVCGGQTHGLLRYGIDEALKERVELIHGPGCPVCVTPTKAIDEAIELAFCPHTLVLAFGDMLRVPGSQWSLMQAKSKGAKIQTVYSPLDAIAIALSNPEMSIVFFAVGFETTLPATAIALLQAARKKLANFYVLLSHVRVAPAMQYILEQVDCGIDGFLAAGHVCTVMGMEDCMRLAERFGVPIVVTGFEPLDLLMGIEECVSLLETQQNSVANLYERVVTNQGNVAAQTLIAEVFEIGDQTWRGLGEVREGGFKLKEAYLSFDANQLLTKARSLAQHNLPWNSGSDLPNDCRSGDVLIGKIKPTACPYFAVLCNPQSPLGAPMVSSEGACAAYYRYANSVQDETLKDKTED